MTRSERRIEPLADLIEKRLRELGLECRRTGKGALVCHLGGEGREFTGTVQHINPSAHAAREAASEVRNDRNLEIVVDEPVSNEIECRAFGIAPGGDPRHGLIGPGVAASHGYERTHRKTLDALFSVLKRYAETS